jgi:hypothetical protein
MKKKEEKNIYLCWNYGDHKKIIFASTKKKKKKAMQLGTIFAKQQPDCQLAIQQPNSALRFNPSADEP